MYYIYKREIMYIYNESHWMCSVAEFNVIQVDSQCYATLMRRDAMNICIHACM